MLTGKHFYNQTLKKCVAVFGSLFNNIKIVQTGKSEVRVPIAYGPRKKFLARISADNVSAYDKSIAIKLPRMSFEISSITFDATTKLNKFNKRTLPITGETDKVNTIFQSVPYDVGMTLNILAKNQDDALQIFEQILPTFSPEYTVAIKDLEGTGTVTDVPIVLTGTSIEDDYEGDFTARRTLIYTLEFNMKVKFAGATSESKIIRSVDTKFYSNISNVIAKVNGSPSSTTTIPIDNVENGDISVGMSVFGTGLTGSKDSNGNDISGTAPTVLNVNHARTQLTISSNQTISDNTILTFKFNTALGEENVRVKVANSDEPLLDETDTITTTFGFTS